MGAAINVTRATLMGSADVLLHHGSTTPTVVEPSELLRKATLIRHKRPFESEGALSVN